jgi:GNAT superfamily N-acetyltransferase
MIQLAVDDWQWIDEFARLYRANMERLGASASYFFADSYFHHAHQQLSGSFHLVSALAEGEYIGGVALFTSGEIVQYHLAASQDEWRSRGITKILIHHAAVWASQHGYREFHLGGGVGGSDDSLSHFKRGFGSNAHPFRVYKVVANAPSYQHLLSRLALPAGDFFPPYCSPAVGA